MEKLLRRALENPPTVGEAAVALVVALLTWGATEAIAAGLAPAYVVAAAAVLLAVLAVGGIGRATQRFTWPTDWLDHDQVRDLLDGDDGGS